MKFKIILYFLFFAGCVSFQNVLNNDLALFNRGKVYQINSTDSEINFYSGERPYFISVYINETKYKMLLDTGAPASRFYNKIKNEQSSHIIIEENPMGHDLHFLSNGRIGNYGFDDVFFAYTEEEEPTGGIDGIIGMNLLTKFNTIQFDHNNKLMRLNIDRFEYTSQIPINDLFFPFGLLLEDSKNQFWLFDTGNFGHSLLNTEVLNSKGLDKDFALYPLKGEGRVPAFARPLSQYNWYVLKTHKFSNLLIKNIHLKSFNYIHPYYAPDNFQPHDVIKGILANSLFQNDFLIDLQNKMIKFRISSIENTENVLDDFLFFFGIEGRSLPFENKIIVKGVMEGFSFDRAGIKKGDILDWEMMFRFYKSLIENISELDINKTDLELVLNVMDQNTGEERIVKVENPLEFFITAFLK